MRQFATGLLAVILFAGTLSAADPPIVAIAASPDGEKVLTGSNRGVTVHVYDDLNSQNTLEVDFSNVHDLAYSPDGKSFAVGGGNPGESGVVLIFQPGEKQPSRRLSQHTDLVFDVTWSSDGKQLFSVGLDKQVLLWNVEKGIVERQFVGHSKGVTSVCWLEEHELLVSAGIDQSLRVWNTSTGELVRTLDNHTAAVNDLALRPSTEVLPMVVSCGHDRTLRFWQPSIGRLVRFARLDATPVAAVWLPAKPHVAIATTDGRILIVDAETTEIIREFQVADERLFSLEISIDGTTLLAGKRHGTLERITIQEVEPE